MQGIESQHILRLNFENTVRKILKDVPVKDHKNVAAVSKDLYEIVCNLDERKFRMHIKTHQLDDATIYASILNSKRKFDTIYITDVPLNDKNLSKLIKIAKKHGASVVALSLEFTIQRDVQHGTIEAQKLQKFFSYLPNLTGLWVFDFRQNSFGSMIGKCSPVLKKVTSFIYKEGYRNPVFVQSFENFSALIADDTVEACCFYHDLSSYATFTRRQSNFRIFQTDAKQRRPDAEALRNTRLEKFTVALCGGFDTSNRFLLQLVKNHENTLRKLKTVDDSDDDPMSAQVVNEICHRLMNLQSLQIYFTNENAASFLAITRLENLTSVKIQFDENFNRYDLVLAMTRLKLNIEKVTFEAFAMNAEHYDPIIKNIGDNWEVDKLKVNYRRSKMNGILESMQSLSTLCFWDFDEDEDPIGNEIFDYNGQVYPLMEYFQSTSHFDIAFIYIHNIFPNLVSLVISKCPYVGLIQLNALLGLEDLQTLKIMFDVKSSILMPSDKEVEAIKDLLNQVRNCRISFSTSFDSLFTDDLASKLDGFNIEMNSSMAMDKKHLVISI